MFSLFNVYFQCYFDFGARQFMKITQATIFPVSIPLIEPIKMANDVVIDAKTVLLSLRDEQGRIGWVASIAPMMTGKTLDSLCASCSRTKRRINSR